MGEALQGRRLAVTGAGSGIGFATAQRFLEEGASVACLDITEELSAPIAPSDGQSAVCIPVDVADATHAREAMDSAAGALGGLDGVVNAAGVSLRRSLEDTTPEDWARIISINLTGPYNICRAAVPYLRAAGGGTIVNIASGAAFKPSFDFSAYCASKAGLTMFTKAIAFDLARDGIRANAVCPGVVDTAMITRAISISPEPDVAAARFNAASAMARMAQPGEIAEVIVFLTSAASSYVTGSAYSVDGGSAYH